MRKEIFLDQIARDAGEASVSHLEEKIAASA
jgi:hypothetical protein